MADGRVEKNELISQEAINSPLELRTNLKGVYDDIEKLIQKFNALNVSVKSITGIRELSEAQSKLSKNTHELTTYQKEAQKVKAQLAVLDAKNTLLTTKNTQELLKQKEAYKQLLLQQKQELGLVKQRTGLFTGLIRSIKSLALAYFSLYGIMNLVRSAFTTTKELESIKFAMRTVITDTTELASTQAFLRQTSKELGVEILKTSESYIRFRATTKQTNITLAQTRDIFHTVAKAGAVLGLSSQRVELALLALEQMASKGTVSMEELRRQLGDQLPGAVTILAKAYDVAIPKLYEMIKANKILADEALPKLAQGFKDAYNLENVKNVDTLAAAQTRLKNAWVEMIRAMELSPTFKAAINVLTKLLEKTFDTKKIKNADAYAMALQKVEDKLYDIFKVSGKDGVMAAIGKEEENARKEVERLEIELKNLGNEYMKLTGIQEKGYSESKEARAIRKERIEQIIEEARANNVLLFVNKALALEMGGYILGIKDLKFLGEDEEKVIKGILEQLREKLRIQKDLRDLAIDDVSIKKYNLEIQKIELLIKKYENLGIELKRNTEKYIDWGEVIKKIIDDVNEKFDDPKYDFGAKLRDDFIAEQTAMMENIGLLDTRKLEHELLVLDSIFQSGLISQEEYTTESLALWIKYNQKLDEFGFIDTEKFKLKLLDLEALLKAGKITQEEYNFTSLKLWLENSEQKIQIIEQFASNVLSIFANLNEDEINLLEEEIDTREDNLDRLEDLLKDEEKLKLDGKNNNVALLKGQIAEEKILRDKAAKELEKAQKRQAGIEFAQQASSIITATASLIAGWTGVNPLWGWIIGLAQAAAMVASFVGMKNKIKSASKYAEGEVDIQGDAKPHSQGGKEVEIERHESIISAGSTKKSKNLLTMINEGKVTDKDLGLTGGINLSDKLRMSFMGNVPVVHVGGVNTKKIESELSELRKSQDKLLDYFERRQINELIDPKTGKYYRRKGNRTQEFPNIKTAYDV